MPPPPTREAQPPGDAGAERVGPYMLERRLRRDWLGEVFQTRYRGAPARLRLCKPGSSAALTAALAALARVRAPGVARPLDSLVDDEGRTAVISEPDVVTLAERGRRSPLPADAAAALGAVLLDGLAALHAAGLVHGGVAAPAVGIDSAGQPRWQDAALAPPPATEAIAVAQRLEVHDCAAMLRDLGSLPSPLDELADRVAAGVPGAPEDADALSRAWRAVAAAAGVALPPPGLPAPIRGLLPPPPRPARRRRLRVPARARIGAALVAAIAAVAVPPAAALAVPGHQPLDRPLRDFLPLRGGERLSYRFVGTAGTVTLTVGDLRTVAGELTAQLTSSAAGEGLPLGLSGGTLAVDSRRATMTAPGGGVRVLVAPVLPGTGWSDSRSGGGGALVTVETRTLLGPTQIDEPAGHFADCLAIALVSRTTSAGGAGATGSGSLWYCAGVGLARAHLVALGRTADIDLVAVK
jgi:hypothetical protein